MKFFSTTYSFVWDLIMDWGFCRDGHALRSKKKLMFSKWFYIFAIISNFLLRYLWLAFLFQNYFIFKSDDGVDFGKLFKV